MYHAIVVTESLANNRVLNDYRVLETKLENGKHFNIVLVTDPDEFSGRVQKAMMSNKPYYFHIYDNGISMRVVFKDAIFRINPNNKNTWVPVQRHGLMLGIPRAELDFYPTRIKEEEKWR